MSLRSIYNKLESCKKDLTDDSSDINSINNNINQLQSCFTSLITTSNTNYMTQRLDYFRERSQSSDSLIMDARNEVQQEMDAVLEEIRAEEARVAAARASASKSK